ncbi:MAG: cobalamin biosynthesis protein [Desulfurococcaceae archaeon]
MDLTWLYPSNAIEFSVILVTALILDYVYPFHRGILYRIHPVHTAYFMALKMFRKLPKTRAVGVGIWFIVVFTHLIFYGILLYLFNILNRMLWLVGATYILKVSISLRLLLDHVHRTTVCLANNDIVCAREAISGAVRRDVSQLGEGHISSAAIETLFENVVDGFTSPLLYYLVIGPLGALFQRLVNTMDAALGYKERDFIKVGWFSARVDDAVNYIPARLTALLTIALCILVKGSPRTSVRMIREEGKRIESINGRVVISAASGCMQVKLEKIGAYTVGREYALPKNSDIVKALRLSIYVCTFFIIVLLTLYLCLLK